MKRIEKTVFISYRRKDIFHALSVFQNLTHHGYDVFFDFSGIGSGDFERIILENIKARAHFLVLLTPSALERCSEPADWLRREIETAIETKRNIIPLMFDGFDFSTPSVANQLTGNLATLKSYNGLQVMGAFFTEAMNRLREQYLNVPLEMVLHPVSTSTQEDAKAQKATLVKLGELIPEEDQRRSLRRKYGLIAASVAVVLIIFSFVFWWLKRQEPERAERREPAKESLASDPAKEPDGQNERMTQEAMVKPQPEKRVTSPPQEKAEPRKEIESDKMSGKSPDKSSQMVTRGDSKTQAKSLPQPEGQRATRVPEQQASSQSATTPSEMGNVTPDKTAPLSSPESRPQQITPAPGDDARIAKSAPPSLIPQDPVKAVEAVNRMKADIRGVIQNKDKITFLITHPKDEGTYLVFVSNLLSSACRETPRQCWFTQEGNPKELDRPPVQRSSKRGIVVHGPDANALANALGTWFETYSTSRLPPEMNGYKEEGTSHLIWIDIGPGSPWKQ
jgi:hypothetical protein